MSEATRITEKGQVTIPKTLREKYDLKPGDEVVWIDTDDGSVVRKRTRTEARGALLLDETSAESRSAVAAELSERLRDRRDRNYGEDGD